MSLEGNAQFFSVGTSPTVPQVNFQPWGPRKYSTTAKRALCVFYVEQFFRRGIREGELNMRPEDAAFA